MTCPECDGAGVVDNSPAAVVRAPWLQSDRPCWRCGGTGEIDPAQADAIALGDLEPRATCEEVAAYTAAMEAHLRGMKEAS